MRITVCVCVQRGQFLDSITRQPELEVLVNTHSHMHTTRVPGLEATIAMFPIGT